MDATSVLVEAGDDASLHVKDALQFFLEGFNDDGEFEDGDDAALTFLLSTPAEKISFADWLAWDAHIDAGDCTHYCQPGIPGIWASLLIQAVAGQSRPLS